MIKALDKIFGSDLRMILQKGFGIDINKVKRISALNNEFYILKNFYDSETDNYRKNVRKYDYYEVAVNRNKTDLKSKGIKYKLVVNKVTENISIKNWEGAIRPGIESVENWADGIGLMPKNENWQDKKRRIQC